MPPVLFGTADVRAEFNSGTYTDNASYVDTGNWVGGVIDDVIGSGTTVGAGSANDDVRFTWYFTADHATGSSGMTFDYTVGANSPNLILRGSGAARTLTLNGDFSWDQDGSDESGRFGSPIATQELYLDLGGGDREFIMTGTSGNSHGLRFFNTISNGGIIFDLDNYIVQADTGGAGNAGYIFYAANTYTGITDVRSGLLRLRTDTASIANSSPIRVGNLRSGTRATTGTTGVTGLPAMLEVGDNTSGNLNRVGDNATIKLDSGYIQFRHGNAAAAGGTENVGRFDLMGFSRIDVENNHASQSYTVQGDSLNPVDGGVARIELTSPGGGASQLKLDSAPSLVGGGGNAASTDISIVPYLTGTRTFYTYDGTTGLRALDTSTEFVDGTGAANFMAAQNDDNVKIAYAVGGNQTTTLTGSKTINSLVIVNQGGGATTTLNGNYTLIVTSGAVLFDAAAGQQGYSDFLSVQTLDFGSAEGVISVQGLRVDQRKEINAAITGTNGVTFSSDQVQSNNNGGKGFVLIGGANLYSGPTTLTKGLFATTAAERIPDGSTVHLGGAAYWRLDGNETIAGLSGDGALNANSKGCVIGSGSPTAGQVKLEAGGELSVDGNDGLDITNADVVVNGGTWTVGISAEDQAGRVDVSGNLTFNGGTLAVDLESGYSPETATTWDIASATTISGLPPAPSGYEVAVISGAPDILRLTKIPPPPAGTVVTIR